MVTCFRLVMTLIGGLRRPSARYSDERDTDATWRCRIESDQSKNMQQCIAFQEFKLAGAGGLEPPNGGIKIRCLTTWLRPIRRLSAPPRCADHSGRNCANQRLAAAPRSSG